MSAVATPLERLSRMIVFGLLVTIAFIAVWGVLMANGIGRPMARWPAQVLATASALLLPLVILAAAAAAFRRRRHAAVMGMAVVAALAATIQLVRAAWVSTALDSPGERLSLTLCVVVAVGLAHGSVLALVPTRSRLLAATKVLTMSLAWITGGLIIALQVLDGLVGGVGGAMAWDILFLAVPAAMVLGVAAAIGTIAVPLIALARVDPRKRAAAASMERGIEVELDCPACGRRQAVRPPGARCPGCRARIMIDFDEPRCAACDYLLYRLAGDQCPECGAPVPAEARWAEPDKVG